MHLGKFLRRLFLLCITAGLLTVSTPSFSSPQAIAAHLALPLAFDYLNWDVNAFLTKISQGAVDPWRTLDADQQHRLVIYYFDRVAHMEYLEYQIRQIFSDPSVENPASAARSQLHEQADIRRSLDTLTPLVESILQGQINEVLVEQGIAAAGTALPPLLFHTTPLPKALILSPRDVIRQDANISLLADLTLEEIDELEHTIENNTADSALVVDVGGIGIYPTMVMRSSNLPWILDTIAHEWTHNYLALRPLGFNYDTTPELRTMNETAASIVGGEISLAVLQRFYPETITPPPSAAPSAATAAPVVEFDFNAEMHTTRVHVDELLAEGKIAEAESFMNARREIFVKQGYELRKLNQAYFAFYGAYADSPGGAAGEDPVGPAVRELRRQSSTLSDFLKTIAKMNSFTALQQSLASGQPSP